MKDFFLRLFIAAIFVVALLAALPSFLHIIGFSMSPDVFNLFRIAVGVAAVAWVIWGPAIPFPPASS